MVNIKVIHKEAVRRFTLPSNAAWIELEAKLRTLFSIPALSPFTLSYTDEDNDVITLSTDIELQEILSSAPTVKFNLKFSTSDDSSDSGDDSSNEVWVLEGGNIPRKRASVTKIETDTSGLQDNVSQKNIVSTTNQELQEPQEPQFIEIDSRDINETSSNKTIPAVDDDLERVDERVDEKAHQINLLDDEFFESLTSLKLSKPSKPIHQTQFEDEPKRKETTEESEESSSSNAFTHFSFEQDQPRQDPVVDLQQFLILVEQNQDVIKENPQLVASIIDIRDQIQRLDSFRQPITNPRRNNNFFNRPITPPIPGYTRHTLFIPPISEFNRSITPPLPGAFPKHSAKPVPWAAQPPKHGGGRAGRGHGPDHRGYGGHGGHGSHRGYGGREGRGRRHHFDDYFHDNREQREKTLDSEETSETEETPELQETTDLQIIYSEQLETLKTMGFKDQDVLVELLVNREGNLEEVLEDLFHKK